MSDNQIIEPGDGIDPILFSIDDPEQISHVWAERAVQMAQIDNTGQKQGEQITIILVCLGRELMGIDVQNVINIRPRQSITRVPRVPAWIVGVTNLRGNIHPVLNLWKYFGLPGEFSADDKDHPGLLVILSSNASDNPRAGDQHNHSTEIIFLVDDVLGVETLTLRRSAVESGLIHRMRPEYIRAIAERAVDQLAGDDRPSQKHIAILDVEALLADPHLIVHDEVL